MFADGLGFDNVSACTEWSTCWSLSASSESFYILYIVSVVSYITDNIQHMIGVHLKAIDTYDFNTALVFTCSVGIAV